MVISKDPIVISRLVQRDNKRIWVSILIAMGLQMTAVASAYLSWQRYNHDTPITNAVTAELIYIEDPSDQTTEQQSEAMMAAQNISEEKIKEKSEIEQSAPLVEEQVIMQDEALAQVAVKSVPQEAPLLAATNVHIVYRPIALQTKTKLKPKIKAKTLPANKETKKTSAVSQKGKGQCQFPKIRITSADKKKIKQQILVRVYTGKHRKIIKTKLLSSSGYKLFDQKFIRSVEKSNCPQENRYYDLAAAYKR